MIKEILLVASLNLVTPNIDTMYWCAGIWHAHSQLLAQEMGIKNPPKFHEKAYRYFKLGRKYFPDKEIGSQLEFWKIGLKDYHVSDDKGSLLIGCEKYYRKYKDVKSKL